MATVPRLGKTVTSPAMSREARLAAFVLLLAVIFVAARAAGSALGPLTTSHSHISYTGVAGTGGGMNMGSPSTPATPPPGGGR